MGEEQGTSGYYNPYYQPQTFSYGENPLFGGGKGANVPNLIGTGLGAVQGIAQGINEYQQIGKIPTNAPGQQEDYNGAPTYNLGQFAIDTNAIDPASVDSTVKTRLAAAGTGFAAGNAIAGPVGGVIGAGIGAVVNGIQGKRKRRRLERKKNERMNSLAQSQNTYNTNTLNYNRQQTARRQYTNNSNRSSRLQNIYNRGNIYG